MKKENRNMVSIPAATLNCLKQMLFSKDNGVDLTSIIKDLSYGEMDDLTSINVALAFNGIAPDIDTGNRYKECYSSFYRYECKGVSLISNTVKTQKTEFNPNETLVFEASSYSVEEIMSVEDWLSLNTSCEEVTEAVTAKIKERENK